VRAASPGGSLSAVGAGLHGIPPGGRGFRGGWSLVGPGGLEVQWPAGVGGGGAGRGLEVPARVRGYREMT
jgi:hypothetical protein